MQRANAVRRSVTLAAVASTAALALPAAAQTVHATLSGYQEVPAISSPGSGRFRASIDQDAGIIYYELEYNNLQGNILQSHIHFGQHGANGGVSLFLCTNLGNGPAGTPTCPGTTSGMVNGTLMAANVVGPTGQQITSGEFNEIVAAIRAGVTYANVHTNVVPSGEIRGQIGGMGNAGGQH